MVASDVESPLIPYLRLPLPSVTCAEWAKKKCSNFGMNPRLYDVHLLLKPGPLGDKRRMFCFFGPPCRVAFIKTDIKTTVAPMEDTYPTTAELKLAAALDFIPASLRFMLQHLFVGKDMSRMVTGHRTSSHLSSVSKSCYCASTVWVSWCKCITCIDHDSWLIVFQP